jgi:2-hydroxychromene-2-carboxylate isomerase
MRTVDWYFDFVSPFSYICLHRLQELPGVSIAYRPVLFAGLLNHFGQKGPAEIPAKRRWTYRWCTWWAQELGLPFRFPASHPFNPLQHLRLCMAAGSGYEPIRKIFNDIWTTGADANDPKRIEALCRDLEVDPAKLSSEPIKASLKKNTEEAAARGVFGVPSFVAEGEIFWGADAVDFLKAYLKDSSVLNNAEMRRIDHLPVGAARKA